MIMTPLYLDAVVPENYLFSINVQHNRKFIKNNLADFLALCGLDEPHVIHLLIVILETLNHSDSHIEFYSDEKSLYWVSKVHPGYEKHFHSIVNTQSVEVYEDRTVKLLFSVPLALPIDRNQQEMEIIIGSLKKNLDKEIFLELKQKKMLSEQARQAQMGEMIAMIAHQWRQPLAAIASTAMDMKLSVMMENYDLGSEVSRSAFIEYYIESLDSIEFFVQNLTTTIDDFRTFHRPDRQTHEVYLHDAVDKAIHIVRHTLESNGIEIITDFKSTKKVLLYLNEMIQVVLNILKNAQDNFAERDIHNPKIAIVSIDTDTGVQLEICDNGGGISKTVISRIFEPYFTTKDEKNGTGLGLYMSRTVYV